MKVLVLIVTYNGQAYIEKCLAGLSSQTYQDFKVLVVDNASTDQTCNLIEQKFPKVQLLKSSTNLGFAAGNNFGLDFVWSDKSWQAVVFLNQDTEVRPTWLAELVKVAQTAPQVGAVQSLLLLTADRQKINTAGNVLHWLGWGAVSQYQEKWSPTREKYRLIGYPSGAAMLYLREVLTKIGFFDPLWWAYPDDLDLAWRARLAGYRHYLAPQAVVYHDYEVNFSARKWYWIERARLAIIWRNSTTYRFLLLLPALLLTEIAVLFYALMSGWLGWKLLAYGHFLKHLPYHYRHRQKIKKYRVVAESDLVDFFSSQLPTFYFKRLKFGLIVFNWFSRWYFKLLNKLLGFKKSK